MWGWLKGKPRHEHDWTLMAVDPLVGTRYRSSDHVWIEGPFTRCLFLCKECGQVDTEEIESHWTKEQLTGQPEQ